MNYPKFIKKGDFVAVTAPSAGITEEYKLQEYENAIKNIKNMGYHFIETENVRTYENGRSSSAKERAKQLMQVWKNPEVSAVIAAAGGHFACEMLDYLDFEELKNLEPKWLQGYSDITNLGYVFTTNLDIVTIYGENIRDYGMNELFENLTNSFRIMQGEEIVQKSFGAYETFENSRNIFESYNLTKKNTWKILDGAKKVHFSGRCLGGCLDIIMNLIGTKYDNAKAFIETYKNDGIIWFFDVFEASTPNLFYHLWQLKNAGYFEHCKGILFGRPCYIREDYEMPFAQAIKDAIGELKIPIILDADIGHIPPQMPIVNGAILDVKCENGKGEIKTFFR